MSIRERVVQLCDKELFCLSPEDNGECLRTVLASREVFEDVRGPFPEDFYGQRLSKFRGNLDAFIKGNWVSIAADPLAKKPWADFAPVHPIDLDVWDFRSTSPNPQIRCFGAWAEQDVFVALTWRWRDDIERFSDEAAECREAWNRLFGTLSPFRGNIDDYIKERYRVV